jgi:hypothetical protein
MTTNYELGLAYVWEYDDDFIELTERTLQQAGISTFRITNHNIHEVTEKVLQRKVSFNFYLDRAWDVDARYEELGKTLQRRKTVIYNAYKKVQHAIDKASMHLEFITAGLDVPHSIIIPPHSQEEDIYLSVDDLAYLGRPFIIKPCNTTGGGIGVVTGAETLKEVLEERITNTDDKYILQEKIYPDNLNGHRAWFRCFWSFGKVIPTWWDDQTHLYSELSIDEIRYFGLGKLLTNTRKIAQITELDFFSTEIVLNTDGKFVVIDYVNDQCDMRIKSKHVDGVPDEVIMQIINNLYRDILKKKRQQAKERK